MKILTILGTRPEIIRLSRLIPLLDKLANHKLVFTGQNFEKNLSDIFFEELKLRKPDFILDSRSPTPMSQIAKILAGVEKIINQVKPERLLVLGDTNSALSVIAAKRQGVKVFHMEAGNRCFDDRVPEEVNRRIIDHSSDILMPYTERSRSNLLREGFASERIFVTGNPIWEVLSYFQPQIEQSPILKKLKLEPKKYFLLTLHRAENVDLEERLTNFLKSFELLIKNYQLPIVYSLHPRTRFQLKKQHQKLPERIIALKPLGLFDFVHLEKNAFCVLSDSGTVQEECAIFKVPNVTLRDTTERPETIEAGSNFLAGCQPEDILIGVKLATDSQPKWPPPAGYLAENVSLTAAKIILSHHQ